MAVEYPERWNSIGGLSNQAIGALLTAAATITPTHKRHKLTGTTQITTITVPWDGFAGELHLYPDGAATTATGGNIAKAITMVANTVCILSYNPADALWYPHVP